VDRVDYGKLEQQIRQDVGVDWLHDVSVESCFARLLPVRILSPPCQGDEDWPLSVRQLSYSARRFETIDFWQADVEQDDIGAQLRSLLHCFEAVVGDVRLVTTSFRRMASDSAASRLSSTTRTRRAIVVELVS